MTASQRLLCQAPNEQSTTATLSAFENDQLVLGPFPAILGHSGLTKSKIEGDMKTPIGTFALPSAFGILDPPPNLKMPYRKVTPTTVCVDDPTSLHYNCILEKTPHHDWKSAEEMHTYQSEYAHGIVIDSPLGSCLFIHALHPTQKSTAGCIGLHMEDLLRIINWLDIAQRPTLTVQLKKNRTNSLQKKCVLTIKGSRFARGG